MICICHTPFALGFPWLYTKGSLEFKKIDNTLDIGREMLKKTPEKYPRGDSND
jgi:hypothetical protein